MKLPKSVGRSIHCVDTFRRRNDLMALDWVKEKDGGPSCALS